MLNPPFKLNGFYMVASLAGFLFGLLTWQVFCSDWAVIDVSVAQWLHHNNHLALTKWIIIFTDLHDPIVLSVITALLALYWVWKKDYFAFLAMLSVIYGGMLLNLILKQLFQRPRPYFEEPLVSLTTYSFPSGHVVASTVFYGVFAIILITPQATRRRLVMSLSIATMMVALVAFSRIYLGAHYLSDVLAGLMVGVFWLSLCVIALHYFWPAKSNHLK